MAFVEHSNQQSSNSTTPVTIVAAPSSNVRRIVRTMTFSNTDTNPHTVTINYITTGPTTWQISQQTLQPGQTFIFNDILVLDLSTNSIQFVLGDAGTTTVKATSHYGDAS